MQIFVVWCTVRILSPEISYLFSLYTEIYNKGRGSIYSLLGAFCIVYSTRSKTQLPQRQKRRNKQGLTRKIKHCPPNTQLHTKEAF